VDWTIDRVRSLAVEACDVAIGGAAHDTGAVLDNGAAPPASVDPLEAEPFYSTGDVGNGRVVQGYEVGVAPHEAHPFAILDDIQRVAGEDRATPVGAGRPVQNGGTVKLARLRAPPSLPTRPEPACSSADAPG
jgi:hypothetical protein